MFGASAAATVATQPPTPVIADAAVAQPAKSMSADASAAKAAWLAKQDLPSWGKAVTEVVDETAAKAAWLAKQDLPSWGRQ